MSDLPRSRGLVSVVLNFWNEERFLDEAIRSVVAQSYDRWELLLVDDGSTDGSPGIAKRAADADPERIRYLIHPGRENRGMSASRNLGLAEARGEYVAFLDGDDVYLPDRLRRHVEVLEGFPRVAMVQSDHIRWRSWAGGHLSERHDVPRHFFCVGDQVLKPPLGLGRILRVPFLVAGTCNFTVRTRVARQVGGFVDSFVSLFEDQAFVARVAISHTIYVLQAYLALYRHHSDSAIRSLAEGGGKANLEVDRYAMAYYDWLIELLESSGDGPGSEWLQLARSRRAGLEPTVAHRLKRRLAGRGKAVLRVLLPERMHAEVVRLDMILDARRGRRDYRRMTDAVGEQASMRASRNAGAA